jgi:tetratricopeptide (TPR) repeat protein
LGAPPNWGSIAAKVDAARDLADDVLASVLVEPLSDRSGPRFVLIHAEAGTGKSTLVKRLGADLALTWKQAVVALRPYGSLDFVDVELLARQLGERVYVLVDDASDKARELSKFLSEARLARAKVTVIAAARTNEWMEAQSDYSFSAPDEFELSRLSRAEIERIIDTLSRNDGLGLLAGVSRETQIAAFESRADKQLLVALREATEGKKFDDIVLDEYESIPSPDGQRAYLLVCSLHRFGIMVRAALLYRALDVPIDELRKRVFDPTAKVIIGREIVTGGGEYYYSARHQLIAEIVFDRKIGTERRRLEYYADLIKYLDVGYSSDADAFRKLTRSKNKQLLRDFAVVEHRRELMAQLLRIDPEDALAYQHAAMMELDSGDLKAAAKYLSRALGLRPTDPSIRDTEGLVLLQGAMIEEDPTLADAKFARAEEVFERNIQRRAQEPFGYRHLAETYLAWSKIQTTEERRVSYVTQAYRTLLLGLGKCASTAMLYQYLGEIESSIGEPDKARRAFANALMLRPADPVTRIMAARLEEQTGNPAAALEILKKGLEIAPLDSELHYRTALLMAANTSANVAEIRAHFEAATLAPSRNYRPRLAYGAFLFSTGDYQHATDEFNRMDELVVPSTERFAQRSFPFGDLLGRHRGRITRRSFSFAIVDYDQGATTVFVPLRDLSDELVRKLSVGRQISFRLAFNLKGPLAVDPELA